MMKNDEIHDEILDRGEYDILYNLYELENKERKIATKILLKNNEVIGGHNKETQLIIFIWIFIFRSHQNLLDLNI